MLLLALPSAVLAFSNRLDITGSGAGHGLANFASGALDPRLAEALSARGVQAAVNRAIVRGDVPLTMGAEVAFLPAMSGG